jgi:hypothetical protein
MRRYFFEILATLLLLGSFCFFWECVAYLSRRDYVSGALLAGIGLAVIHVGVELARLALVERT